MPTFQRGLLITTALFALAVPKTDPGLGDLIVPTPYLRVAICIFVSQSALARPTTTIGASEAPSILDWRTIAE
jgi:hypothetical protein